MVEMIACSQTQLYSKGLISSLAIAERKSRADARFSLEGRGIIKSDKNLCLRGSYFAVRSTQLHGVLYVWPTRVPLSCTRVA